MSISLQLPSSNSNGDTTTVWTKMTGFRTIVLDLTPYSDRPGNHFSFVVNGERFNMKGSNMVPMDPFENRVDAAWYRRLLEAAVASNYNTIRVWSSGNYYSDLQYTSQQVFRRVVSSVWYEPTNETMQIWIASDEWEAVNGTLIATWMSWSGDVLNSSTYDFQLEALDSKILTERTGWSEILPGSSTSNNSVLLIQVDAATSLKKYSSENFWVPNYISNATMVDPGLKFEKTGSATWNVTSTTGIAAYVWLTEPNGAVGHWDQNAVFLAKGETRQFVYKVQNDNSNGSWEDGVRVRSLWDNFEMS